MSITDILEAIDNDTLLSREQVVHLLDLELEDLKLLYRKADSVREQYVGNDIYLRGIVEFSNYCGKNCNYCGIRGANAAVERYRMTQEEIVEDFCDEVPAKL
ncbi:MAG: hypothetical protein KKB12_00145 [Candidatus Omnitrophica bacterium]|nr:hypothetical protein [Candidatus Omnitrophota bacterium]